MGGQLPQVVGEWEDLREYPPFHLTRRHHAGQCSVSDKLQLMNVLTTVCGHGARCDVLAAVDRSRQPIRTGRPPLLFCAVFEGDWHDMTEPIVSALCAYIVAV